MKRVTDVLRERCLAGRATAAEAVDAGVDPAEAARCFMRILPYAPAWIAAALARGAVVDAAARGYRARTAYDAPALLPDDIDAFRARFVDRDGNVIVAWDSWSDRYVAVSEDEEFKHAINAREGFAVEASVVLRDGTRETIALQCAWRDNVRLAFSQQSVREMFVPPDVIVPEPIVVELRGVWCLAAHRGVNTIAYGRGGLRLVSELGATSAGHAMMVANADGSVSRVCVLGFCIDAPDAGMARMVVDASAFKFTAEWSAG